MLPHQPPLGQGNTGPEVGNWQRFLNAFFRGKSDTGRSDLLVVDEDFGPKTASVTQSFQLMQRLKPDAIVGPRTRAAALPFGFVEFVQAARFDLRWPRTRKINLIVIHTMECLELPEAGENVALWFAGKTKYEPPMASAHFCVDSDSIVQCVREMDVAWHAKQVNARSVGIEHAGFAKQTQEDWSDAYSREMLVRSADLARRIAEEHQIPVRRLTPDEVRSGLPGFCGHIDVTNAYDRGIGHWDPGTGFPWEEYLAACRPVR